MWWFLTSDMSFLPIHAAGIYVGQASERRNLLDYAVSSYIPTISALNTRVKNWRPIDPNHSGLFLTSQPYAPDASPIPGTAEEVQSILKGAQESNVRVGIVDGSDLTVDDCLRHMANYSSIHLACHATQNTTDPLQSQLLLHNGSLSLATIIQANLENADLAFLSACQTSTGIEQLPDEAVHLAAGMLAAGYQRVVATMWSIGDQSAQDVATEFYEYLFRTCRDPESPEHTVFDGRMSAYALHHSVQQLRARLGDDREDALLAWIPFVHFGY